MVYVLKLKLIDWCLMPIVAVFQLYLAKNKLSLQVEKYEILSVQCNYAEIISF